MNFLRWLAITTTYIVIFIIVEYNYNYFHKLFQGDSTFISETIAGIFLLGVGLSLFYSLEEKPKFKKVFRLASVCTMLGLLGSIIGFAQTFAGFDIANLQLDNQEEVKNMMASVATGIPTALNTTVMGIYASLALIAYPFLIRRNVK